MSDLQSLKAKIDSLTAQREEVNKAAKAAQKLVNKLDDEACDLMRQQNAAQREYNNALTSELTTRNRSK